MCKKNDYKNQIEYLATELCILKSENYWIVKKLLEQEVVLQQLKHMVDDSLTSKSVELS